MVGGHSCRDDQASGLGHVAGVMSKGDAGTHLGESPGCFVLLQVATRDLAPLPQEQLREGAHAGATDPHKMDRPVEPKDRRARAMTRAALGRARFRAAADMDSRRWVSAMIPSTASRRTAPVRSDSGR